MIVRKYHTKRNNLKLADKMKIVKRLVGCMANSPNWKNVDAVLYQRKLRREKGI